MKVIKSQKTEMELLQPQIRLIKDAKIFHAMKESKVGGPCLVFHRYHEAGVTRIKRAEYDDITETWTETEYETVQNIIGFDANSLYLWCLAQQMPCGQLNFRFDANALYLWCLAQQMPCGQLNFRHK